MAIKKEVKKTIGNSKRMRTANEHAVTTAVAPAEAIAALRKFKATKFDQTINVVFHLGIDPKAADQALRGSIALPHGIGKSARVVAFCGSDKVAAAKAAGAVEAGAEVTTGGAVGDRDGYFYQPSVVVNPAQDAEIATAEVDKIVKNCFLKILLHFQTRDPAIRAM